MESTNSTSQPTWLSAFSPSLPPSYSTCLVVAIWSVQAWYLLLSPNKGAATRRSAGVFVAASLHYRESPRSPSSTKSSSFRLVSLSRTSLISALSTVLLSSGVDRLIRFPTSFADLLQLGLRYLFKPIVVVGTFSLVLDFIEILSVLSFLALRTLYTSQRPVDPSLCVPVISLFSKTLRATLPAVLWSDSTTWSTMS